MMNNNNFRKIVFFLILCCITGMGAALYQNIMLERYPWVIGDVIVIILLYVDAYLYAREIEK